MLYASKNGYANYPKKLVNQQDSVFSSKFFRPNVASKNSVKSAVNYSGNELRQEKRKSMVMKANLLYLRAGNGKTNGQHERTHEKTLSRVSAAPSINETLFFADFLVHVISRHKPKHATFDKKIQKAMKKVESLQNSLKDKTFHLTRQIP